MPIPEEAADRQPNPTAAAAPGQISRRSVLRSAAGAGAAGFAVTALAGAPALASRVFKPAASTPHPAEPTDAELTAAEAVVVHVRDLRTGQMDVYRGTSHVRVRDRQLAAALARASK